MTQNTQPWLEQTTHWRPTKKEEAAGPDRRPALLSDDKNITAVRLNVYYTYTTHGDCGNPSRHEGGLVWAYCVRHSATALRPGPCEIRLTKLKAGPGHRYLLNMI